MVVELDVPGGQDAGEVRPPVEAERRRPIVVLVARLFRRALEGSEAPGLVRLGRDLRGDAREEDGNVRGQLQERDVLPGADV